MSTTLRKPREQWGSKVEFILACIGSGPGIMHFLRFPYLCYRFGGGAFLVPYFIILTFCAFPLLYMEIAVGQLTRLGPMQAMHVLCPLLKGVGITTVIVSFLSATYFITPVAWSLYYFFNSFKNPLPWTRCGEFWNTDFCISDSINTTDAANQTLQLISTNYNTEMLPTESSSYQYFRYKVLQISSGLSDLGGLNGSLVGYLFLAWILCYLCTFKGVRVAGKVAYVTTLLPHVILLILLIRNLTLPGAANGLRFLFVPDWSQMVNLQTWKYAGLHAFSGVGFSEGCVIAFSSYNNKRNNILIDVLVISTMKVLTSVIAGCVVFAGLGAVADMRSVSVTEVATGGYDLLFVAMPSLFNGIPHSNAWTALFFLMIICFGIAMQFSMVLLFTTTIHDQFHEQLKRISRKKELVSLIVCIVCFLCGLLHVSRGGIHTLLFIDYYGYVPFRFIGYFEVMAICWLYGGNRLAREISFSSGQRPSYIFPFFWMFISPIFLTYVLWPNLAQMFKDTYSLFPAWAIVIGGLLSTFCIMWIPGGALHELYKNGQGKSFCSSLFKSVTPTFVGEHVLRKQEAISGSRHEGGNEGNREPYALQPLVHRDSENRIEEDADGSIAKVSEENAL